MAPFTGDMPFELDYLTFWTGEFDPIVSHPLGGGVSFAVPDPVPRTATYGDVQLTISSSSAYSSRGRFTRADMSLPVQFKNVLSVSSTEPVSVDDLLDISRRLSDLITVAMHRPSGVRDVEFHEPAGCLGTSDRFEWWSADDLPSENTTLDEGNRRRINFRLSDVDDVGQLLARWHDLHTTAFYGVASVVAQLRETTTFYETRLLGVCGTVEALHRGLSPVPKKLDYRERCAALAAIPPAVARAQIVPDIDEWAGHVTRARNHLAHGDEPGARTVPQDVWYGLHERTVALLVLVLMTKLGLSDDIQVRALKYGALRVAANRV